MDQAKRTQAIIDVLADRATVEEVAREFGVSTDEVTQWKALYLDGAAGAAARRRPVRAFGVGRSVAIGLSCVLVSTVGWVDYARSQSTCNQTLPAPLTTFCPGDPASAAQVNGNFQQIVDWLQAKVGAVSAAGVSTPTVTATNVNATTVTATRVAAGGYTPPAAGWASQGTGTNGAAIYNDTSSFRTLMVVGNDSAGSGRRRVGLWDDVTVSGNMSVPSNSWDSASYTGGNAYCTARSRPATVGPEAATPATTSSRTPARTVSTCAGSTSGTAADGPGTTKSRACVAARSERLVRHPRLSSTPRRMRWTLARSARERFVRSASC